MAGSKSTELNKAAFDLSLSLIRHALIRCHDELFGGWATLPPIERAMGMVRDPSDLSWMLETGHLLRAYGVDCQAIQAMIDADWIQK